MLQLESTYEIYIHINVLVSTEVSKNSKVSVYVQSSLECCLVICGTAQFQLDRTSVRLGLDTIRLSLYVHAHKHACVHNINDIKPIVQSSHVHNGHMHDGLHSQACMSGMHMPNLDCVH